MKRVVAFLVGPVVVACAQQAPTALQTRSAAEGRRGTFDGGPKRDAFPIPSSCILGDAAMPYVRTHRKGVELRIDYEERSFHYRFDESASFDDHPKFLQRPYMYRIDAAETVKLLEKAGVVYLLIHVEGPSRAGGMHYCGAGNEEALALFTFDRSGEVKPPEFVLTRSCWLTIEAGDPGFRSPMDGHLVGDLRYIESGSADAGLNETIDVHVAFDPDRPEAGLTFARRASPFSP